jgi:mono/diheme cytochrome c family protein
MKRILLILGITLVTAGVIGAQVPAGDAKRGEGYYMKNGCWECHGYTGQSGNGARLVTTALNANGFANYIRNPRTNQMPTYSAKVISDQDAADLFAYIKTFKRPPEAKDIPLLQQIINENKQK